MSSTFGKRITVTLFGESHGESIGAVMQGLPAGLKLDFNEISAFLLRRKAKNALTTARLENDDFKIISGFYHEYTTGMPLTVRFENQNIHSEDYDFLKQAPRPGHADFPAAVRSDFHDDLRGGGHHSGRLTLPYCFCGAVALQMLKNMGIEVVSHLSRIGTICDDRIDPTVPDIDQIKSCYTKDIPMVNRDSENQARELLKDIITKGDSIGAQVECAVTGLPVGLGSPFFDSMESVISHALFSIPGIKGVSFGDEAVYTENGSAYNDCYQKGTAGLTCKTNHAGGIIGGYTNGMPMIVLADFRPTASISKTQYTADWNGNPAPFSITGRHDPCIALRALPAVESAAALTILDFLQ